MQLFTSTNGGASFGATTDIAHIGSGYTDSDNAQLTLNDSGGGWLTYHDGEGLQVANLSPLSQPSPNPSLPPNRDTSDLQRVIEDHQHSCGGSMLTLKVPKECLSSLQPFYVGVGKKKRHGIAKELGTKIKVSKVTFSFDGQKKILKKKPFRWLIKPPVLTAGKKYTVKARVTVLVDRQGVKKRVVKTLKGQVSVC